jgi:hypothetical protein
MTGANTGMVRSAMLAIMVKVLARALAPIQIQTIRSPWKFCS